MSVTRVAVIAKSANPYSPTNLGQVINAIMADPATHVDAEGDVLVADPMAAKGWTYDGTKFIAPVADDVPTVGDLVAYANSLFNKVLIAGQTFNVAAAGQPAQPILCDGTNSTRADLALLVAYATAVPSGFRTWVDNNNVKTDLTSAEILSLAMQAGLWVSSLYPALSELTADIEAGSITTMAQIATFAWPSPVVAPVTSSTASH